MLQKMQLHRIMIPLIVSIIVSTTISVGMGMLREGRQVNAFTVNQLPANLSMIEIPVEKSPVEKSSTLTMYSYRTRFDAIIDNEKINEAQRSDMLKALKGDYVDNTMHFTGRVDDVTSKDDKYNLRVINGKDRTTMCSFEKNRQHMIYTLQKGQSVIVVGTVQFFMMASTFVHLTDCEIIVRK